MRIQSILQSVIAAVSLCGLSACANVTKLDLSSAGRASWQRPAEVVAALRIQPGDRVADLGAGDGYFLAYLSEAVGPDGRVYAADVEVEKIDALRVVVAESGFENVEVILADLNDPHLPDLSLDLVLLVNTYHHIEDRPAYFRALQRDLAEGGRVAVIEPNGELTGLLRLFLDEGHTSERAAVGTEMEAAGYRLDGSHDFLPIQILEVFAPQEGVGGLAVRSH